MSTFYAVYPPTTISGTIVTTNASVGPTGTTAPTSATEVGGVDNGGNLRALSTDSSGDLNVNMVNTFIKSKYDYVVLTYVTSGNGAGQVQTITYKLGGSGGTTVNTLTMVYDGSNNLSTVTLS